MKPLRQKVQSNEQKLTVVLGENGNISCMYGPAASRNLHVAGRLAKLEFEALIMGTWDLTRLAALYEYM